MPELPEVEIVRRSLLKELVGKKILSVEVFRELSIGYPTPERFRKELKGQTFRDISRRGKYLLFHLNERNKFLIVHLRMSGRLLLVDKKHDFDKRSKFVRVNFMLNSGEQLIFEDMRVFGRLWAVSSKITLAEAIPSFASLGIEPLNELNGKQLQTLFHKKRQSIKTALLDQRLLTGIGNIYADEILFQAGIHPLTPAGKINKKQAKNLAKVIPNTLNKAIKLGGSSIKDFVDAKGVNGNYQHSAFVYGRTGRKCRLCKSPIERIKLAGRSTHFCLICQK